MEEMEGEGYEWMRRCNEEEAEWIKRNGQRRRRQSGLSFCSVPCCVVPSPPFLSPHNSHALRASPSKLSVGWTETAPMVRRSLLPGWLPCAQLLPEMKIDPVTQPEPASQPTGRASWTWCADKRVQLDRQHRNGNTYLFVCVLCCTNCYTINCCCRPVYRALQ